MGIRYRRYSVYRRSDEMPIIIFATAEKCAEAIGCKVDTFRSYLSRQKKGYAYPKNILIYQDQVTKKDKKRFLSQRKAGLNALDRNILHLILAGNNMSETARKLGTDPSNVFYHVKKIKTVTGYDPRFPANHAKIMSYLETDDQQGGPLE